MPNENGTATTRPDAPIVADSPSVDAAEETAAVVIDKENSNGEDAQTPQGADSAEADTMEGLKVVMSIKGDRATIGVKGTSSDPHIESFDAPDLSGLAQEVPAVVERAMARWEDAPKHPAHVKPAPPAKRRSQRGQGTAQAAAEGGSGQQQAETLRLF